MLIEPIAPGRDESGVEDAHEAGERDELDAALPQCRVRLGGKSRAVRLRDRAVRDSGAGGARQPRRLGAGC